MYQNYKVVVNTAAGRRRYMQYLVPPILNADIVDRYDIWVNTHNMVDIEFFKKLAGSSSNLVVNSLSLYFQVNNYPFLLTFIRKYRH